MVPKLAAVSVIRTGEEKETAHGSNETVDQGILAGFPTITACRRDRACASRHVYVTCRLILVPDPRYFAQPDQLSLGCPMQSASSGLCDQVLITWGSASYRRKRR